MRNRVLILIALPALLVAVVSVGVFSVSVTSQQPAAKSTQPFSQDSSDATPVQEGVLTEKEKAHSKLYKQYRPRRNIVEQARDRTDVKFVYKGEPDPSSIQSISCGADLVVLAHVQAKSSQLTEGNNFIFTDYELGVEGVWKNNSPQSIVPGSLLTITRPGGVIKLNGKILTAWDSAYDPLRVGDAYLVFLKFIPETKSYMAVNSASTFQLMGGKIVSLRPGQVVDADDSDPDVESFQNRVTKAQNGCNPPKP